MEYVSRGKLQTYLRESRTPNDYNNLHGPSAMLTSRDLTTFAHQVARGMHYLTERGVSGGREVSVRVGPLRSDSDNNTAMG